MLLTIHNLPAATRYADIKSLLQSKCGIQQVILDNLVSEGNSKTVTVGVAEDADAAILTRKINGLFWNGQQLYVEDVRPQKAASDQPYRSMNPQLTPQGELPFMNLAENSSYNMMAAQQMMAPMYYMPVPYPSDAYGDKSLDTQSYRQEKVQSAYPGISGFAQNAPAVPQYGALQFENERDYGQPAKRSRWEDDNQDSANEKPLYARRQDRNRDWQTDRASPPQDQSRDRREAVWQMNNDEPIQPDFRADVRPTQPDYRSNAGPTQPDFRSNVRPTEPEFRSTIRPEKRSDFARREFGSNIQRKENERQRSDQREEFSRRPNAEKFSRRPNDEFSRRPNDEFSRRPNDEFSRQPNVEFSRKPKDELSRRPNERAEFSRRPNVPDRSNERQGTSRSSGRPSAVDEPSRRPNEKLSRRPNDRDNRPRKPNENAEFSGRPNVPNRSNERQGTNRFSGRTNEFSEGQGKSSRFNQPNISRNNSGFERNERPDVSRRAPSLDQGSIPNSRKRKFEEFKPKTLPSAPPKPLRQQFSYQPIAAPPLTEQSKNKLNKRMRTSGTNKILHDIYASLNYLDPDPITRRTFRQVVRERVEGLLGDRKMVTSLEIFEMYRAKYPKYEDKATHAVVVERIAEIVANENNGGNQDNPVVLPVVKPVNPVVQPPPVVAPTQIAASNAPPSKPLTKSEKRAMKNLKDAKQLLSQGKLPTFPLGDKSKVQQHRKEEKLGIIPETEPNTTAAITDEVDALLQICTDELVNPPDDITRQIYKSVCPEEFIGDMKTTITQSLARRVTDTGLKIVRVYGCPKLPQRDVLEKYLIKFGVQSLRKADKSKMFTAAVDTYTNYDKLSNTTYNAPDGITVHFKPFHVAPKLKVNQTLLKKIRQRNLKQMVDRSELNLLDKDWPAKEEEIKAREAELAKIAAESAALEEEKALEASQAMNTENFTENLIGDENTENVQADLTNTNMNQDDSEVDQTNTTVNNSNDYLNDDFHVIDEVNETDSDLEYLKGDTDNQVFYIDEDIETGVANDVVNHVNIILNENTVENNFEENAVGDSANDNNDDENAVGNSANDNNDDENAVGNSANDNNDDVNAVGDSETDNNDEGNYTNIEDQIDDGENANNEDNVDDDGDFEMGGADMDNIDIDLDEIDDGDLEDY